MKINYNGQELDAYALIMKKENALDILSGKKTVEFRAFTPKYEKMFTDFAQIKKNDELVAQGREDECLPPFNTETGAVHFYPYSNNWHLNVLIDEIGTVDVTEKGAKFLAETFGCHEYDDQWQQFAHLPSEEIPFVFYLHIEKVLDHSGLC